MIKSGVSTVNAKAKKCWGHSGMKHILSAEEMALWLKKSNFSWLGTLQEIDPKSFETVLVDRKGIIFFKDYWQRGDESFENRSGDHIDLWDRNKMTGGSMFSRSFYEFFGVVSDLSKSRKIW